MKKDSKIIKFLETTAIMILIVSFIILAYCVYISFTTEQEILGDYDAQKTVAKIEETQEKSISDIIETTNKSVVGISKVKNKGNTIFLKEGTSELGLGTGFIVTSEGYIVTNQHVSGDKNSTCYVTLEDGRNYEATVVWADSDIDLSVVKINAKNLEFLKLGDSENIKIAQKVYAIGNPIGFEFQRTVTSGIVSAINRTIVLNEQDEIGNEKSSYMEDLIQTDATINPGNSGGPLINESGEVIGVNSVKITSAEGIGFAVPINSVKAILKSFISTGGFEEAYLGIFAYDKNVIPYLDSNLQLDKGIYVVQVNGNSAAAKYGIQEKDVLLEVDGLALEKMCDLRSYIYTKKPGDEVTFKVLRNKKEMQIAVKLLKK